VSKPVILSGIQPSGDLHIGHYIGAMKNWVSLQADYQCFFMVVDLHAITVRQNPEELRERCYSIVAQYIASGIDPEEHSIFLQSHVSQHSELAWILNCYTSMGQLNRMTQFKEKALKHEKNVNAGLFTYPVLMAADILLYNADCVPVGDDQKQHLELARDIAQRFNGIYDEVFQVPEPYIAKSGARIMSLQDPESKMSKSDENEKNCVFLLDPPKKISKKIKSAVTDSDSVICFDMEKKPGVSNLLTIHSALSGRSMPELVASFEGKQYGHLKVETAEVVVDALRPVQERYEELMKERGYLEKVLKSGADRAREKASHTMKKVREVVGFVSPF
jgi:tryptophanyl-tRNA synthetase